jgi:hypothetical protein
MEKPSNIGRKARISTRSKIVHFRQPPYPAARWSIWAILGWVMAHILVRKLARS